MKQAAKAKSISQSNLTSTPLKNTKPTVKQPNLKIDQEYSITIEHVVDTLNTDISIVEMLIECKILSTIETTNGQQLISCSDFENVSSWWPTREEVVESLETIKLNNPNNQ